MNVNVYEDSEKKRYRAEALARARQAGMDINIPVQKPRKAERPKISALLAPDGRKDISTIDLVRKGKNY